MFVIFHFLYGPDVLKIRANLVVSSVVPYNKFCVCHSIIPLLLYPFSFLSWEVSTVAVALPPAVVAVVAVRMALPAVVASALVFGHVVYSGRSFV